MSKGVVEIEVKGVLPTTGGCGVFLGNDDKVFVIYVDQMVGVAITMFMRKAPKERPQTHDLMADILLALGGKVQRVVINHFDSGVYYARLIISCENELQEKKIIEIDARPSDSIALAVQQDAPIYVSQHVWDDAEDMGELLKNMEAGIEPGSSIEGSE
ncbi:MAG: bifunctional DNase/RNase [Verrucomicrobiales bacterium]|jgi:bifunctional DNase/RNase